MKSLHVFMMNNPEVLELGYGYLYNWYAANDANFAPTDWKVPARSDYISLASYLGATAGGQMKESGLIYWNSPNTGATNTSGFTGYGGGQRTGLSGSFSDIKDTGYFWTTTNQTGSNYYSILLQNYTAALNESGLDNNTGCSIRLLYTGAGTPTTVTDYDGNEYDVQNIGSQYWTVQNWKCTHLNNGTALTKVTDATAWTALTTEGYCAYDNDENYV